MFSNNNINCANYGMRAPISHRLIAGQYRGLGRAHIFQNQTIINNNFGCHGGFDNYGYYVSDWCCDNSGGNWMEKLFGIGAILTAAGTIFGGKKDKEDGAGDTPDTSSKDKEWVETIKTQYPNAKVSVNPDGGVVVDGVSYKDGEAALKALAKPKDTTEITDPPEPPDAGKLDPKKLSTDLFTDLFTQDYIDANFDAEKGLKVGDKYYKDVAEAYDAANGDLGVKPQKADLNSGTKTLKTAIVIKAIDDVETSALSGVQTTTIAAGTTLPNTVTIGNRKYKVDLTKNGYVTLECTEGGKKAKDGNNQVYILEENGTANQIDDTIFITNGTGNVLS